MTWNKDIGGRLYGWVKNTIKGLRTASLSLSLFPSQTFKWAARVPGIVLLTWTGNDVQVSRNKKKKGWCQEILFFFTTFAASFRGIIKIYLWIFNINVLTPLNLVTVLWPRSSFLFLLVCVFPTLFRISDLAGHIAAVSASILNKSQSVLPFNMV